MTITPPYNNFKFTSKTSTQMVEEDLLLLLVELE